LRMPIEQRIEKRGKTHFTALGYSNNFSVMILADHRAPAKKCQSAFSTFRKIGIHCLAFTQNANSLGRSRASRCVIHA